MCIGNDLLCITLFCFVVNDFKSTSRVKNKINVKGNLIVLGCGAESGVY